MPCEELPEISEGPLSNLPGSLSRSLNSPGLCFPAAAFSYCLNATASTQSDFHLNSKASCMRELQQCNSNIPRPISLSLKGDGLSIRKFRFRKGRQAITQPKAFPQMRELKITIMDHSHDSPVAACSRLINMHRNPTLSRRAALCR